MLSPATLLVGDVRAAMAPPPPCLPPETPLAEALAAMAAPPCSCVLAVDGDGRPIGILTEQDVARRVAFRLPPEAMLSAAMTTPVLACGAGDGLWRGIALLRAHRLRHLPVLDGAGSCIGLLHRAETLAAASGRMLDHLEALAGPEHAVKAAQAGVARALLAEGLPPRGVVDLVNGINLDLHRRILARALAAQGPPPVPFALLAMGSLGRGESLLAPDQDNGFVLDDYPDAEHAAIDPWFRAVAEAFNQGLAAAGFTLCKGGVMARNPLWRKTRAQWHDQWEIWARRRSGAALLFADIFVDFRLATGPEAWGVALRRHLTAVITAQPALLAMLAAQDARFGVGLTLWGGFADDEPGPGTRTDLKLHGLMPLVAAARLAALSQGVAAVSTPARLAALRDGAALIPAFDTLLGVLLRQQLADVAAGLPPGNLVDTAALPAEDRASLRDGLRRVRSFARSTFAGFTGQMW